MKKITIIEQEEWYKALIEELMAGAVETIFNSRWELIKGKWHFGDLILQAKPSFEREKIYGERICDTIAQSLEWTPRRVWECLQFRKKYPDLDQLPEGKNISWYKITHKYLPQPRIKKETLPIGKYGVIYADPCWPYPERYDTQNFYGSASKHYDILSLEELAKLPVNNLANENSVLFLWVATLFLKDSFKLIEDWGFEYKSNMVWVKERKRPGIGFYVRGNHELLLIATKGSYLPKTKEIVSSVINAPIGEHSEKPPIVYDIIEKLYPSDQYIELFARNKEKRVNWSYWGNEANDK